MVESPGSDVSHKRVATPAHAGQGVPHFFSSVIGGGRGKKSGGDRLYSVAVATDASGAVQERYKYDAYGLRLVSSGSGALLTTTAIGNEWGFQGRYLDTETNLIYNRTRYRSPSLGRFLSRMPWEKVSNLVISNYSPLVLPNEAPWRWQTVMLGHVNTGPYNYIQDRFNLYDYEHNNPSNNVEPFTGDECAANPEAAATAAEVAAEMAGEEGLAARIATCKALHAAYDNLGDCSCKGCDKATVAAGVACLSAEVAGRTAYLAAKCDYVLPGSIARGSAAAQAGHVTQLAEKSAALAKCTAKLANMP